LDEGLATAGVDVVVVADLEAIVALLRCARLPLHAPLDHSVDVNRAGVKQVEAVLKRVLKLSEMEVLRATLVGAIQKRAIVVVFGHP
jgi:hypothetical protein